MRRTLALVFVLFVAASAARGAPIDPTVLEAQSKRIEIVRRVSPAVIAIFGQGGQGGGSGVVISADGYALSNFHVTKGAGRAMKCGMPDGQLYDAVIVGIDPTGDVALLKLLGRDDFPHARFGDSDDVRVGDWVYVVGNPFLLATDFQPTVTYGIVSGVHRYQYPAGTILEYTDCIQTDASINPGNSGGPMFDAEGQLIGINGRGSFEKRGRVNVGVGYAISINQIQNFLGRLRSGRIVDHATLGARFTSNFDGRVVVQDILDTSDAYRRGLQVGDELVRFGGRAIRTVNGFKNVLGILPKGWRVPLVVRRDGKLIEMVVRLDGVHTQAELWAKAEGRRPDNHDKPPENQSPAGDDSLPAAVRDYFESRQGYANYYFNRLNRQRVWDGLVARGGYASADGTWTLTGPVQGGGTYRIDVDSAGAAIETPAGNDQLEQTDNLTAQVGPPGSGGLLAALFLWRRLLVLGPERFGDVYYLGTAPLEGGADLLDVTVGTYGGVECRFVSDPASGDLVKIEFFPEDDVDPCEIYLYDYTEVEGRFLPGRIEVRHGDEIYGTFEIEKRELKSADSP